MTARNVSTLNARLRFGVFSETIGSERARLAQESITSTYRLFDHFHRIILEGLAPRDAIDALMALPVGHDVPAFMLRARG